MISTHGPLCYALPVCEVLAGFFCMHLHIALIIFMVTDHNTMDALMAMLSHKLGLK